MHVLDQLTFHNVTDLPAAPGGGVQLARFPNAIWNAAEAPAGAVTIRSSNACEIRFVSDRPRLRIYLRSLSGDAQLVHLLGNHIYTTETLHGDGIHCLEIQQPLLEPNRKPEVWKLGGFAPHVYRIHAVGATLAYHGMDPMGGVVRPPTSEEQPRLRWLAYGSSITQSQATFFNYVTAAAQMLEVDALNLGMGGSCWLEKPIAKHIAERDDWDVATFELGINMVRPDGDNRAFGDRVAYLLDKVTAAHPQKPVFLLTIFDHGTYHEQQETGWQRNVRDKNEILRVAAERHPSVTLVEGTDIVPDLRGFQIDLLHPEPFAYTRMGLRLAEAMQPVVQSLRSTDTSIHEAETGDWEM